MIKLVFLSFFVCLATAGYSDSRVKQWLRMYKNPKVPKFPKGYPFPPWCQPATRDPGFLYPDARTLYTFNPYNPVTPTVTYSAEICWDPRWSETFYKLETSVFIPYTGGPSSGMSNTIVTFGPGTSSFNNIGGGYQNLNNAVINNSSGGHGTSSNSISSLVGGPAIHNTGSFNGNYNGSVVLGGLNMNKEKGIKSDIDKGVNMITGINGGTIYVSGSGKRSDYKYYTIRGQEFNYKRQVMYEFVFGDPHDGVKRRYFYPDGVDYNDYNFNNEYNNPNVNDPYGRY